MYKLISSIFSKKTVYKTLHSFEMSEEEQLQSADNQQIVGGKRRKLGKLVFRGTVRNGSPNASILNRLSGKRLG